jgi:hypothetical protein
MTDKLTARRAALAEEVEWWDIERRTTRAGRTTYGVSIFGERIVAGKRNLMEAINAALVELHARAVYAEPLQQIA